MNPVAEKRRTGRVRVLRAVAVCLLGLVFLLAHAVMDAATSRPEWIDERFEGFDLEDTRRVMTFYEEDPDSEEKRVVALAVLDAPLQAVWQTVVDYQSLGRGSTMLTVDRIETSDDRLTRVDLTLDLPWPMKDMDCSLEFVEDPVTHRMMWKNVGGCVRNNRGQIQLQSRGGKTLMRFCVALELGNALPQWLVNYVLRKRLPDEIHLIREAVRKRQAQAGAGPTKPSRSGEGSGPQARPSRASPDPA